MKSAEKSKRRFWRIHLSTAVILMLAAGVLLWRSSLPVYVDNLKPDWSKPPKMIPTYGEMGSQWGFLQHGWPVCGYRTQAMLISEEILQKLQVTAKADADKVPTGWAQYYVPGKGVIVPINEWHEFNTAGILIDSAVALAILAALATLLEFLIRRREPAERV